MSAIGNDAPSSEVTDFNYGAEDLGDGQDAFLKMMTLDAEKPSGSEEDPKKKKVGTPADDSADTAVEEEADAPAEELEADAEAADADDAEETAEDRKIADDGAYVKIKVGDKEDEVPVKDLTRLYGQEKALTQKSMEVAEQRKTVEAELAKNVAATNSLLERAKKKFEPYSKIDFLVAAKELPAEDFANLRQAAQAAFEDVQFLEQGLNGLVQDIQKQQHNDLVTKANAAIKVLTGPVDQGGIDGWNEQKYNDVRSFAVGQGLDQQIVDNLVDPAAIRIIHNAMLYERGKSKVVTTKVNKTPKKVVKTTRAAEQVGTGTNNKSKADAAMRKLRSSGSVDDAAEAFLAGWESSDE